MGFVGTTEQFLPKAFELVKSGGVIHYHEVCPIDEFPERPLQRIAQAAGKVKVEVLRQAEVKSYAPAISHYVIDFRATF
jgi:tRNA wybutosine-synthesizing protein 2